MVQQLLADSTLRLLKECNAVPFRGLDLDSTAARARAVWCILPLRHNALETATRALRQQGVGPASPESLLSPRPLACIFCGVPRVPFIPPALAKLRSSPSAGVTFGPTSGRAHMAVAGTYPLSAIKDAVAHAQRGGKISFLTSPDAPPITPIVRDCDETIVVQRLQRVGE